MPTPSFFRRTRSDDNYYIAWAIDGYFGTRKGREAINDIKARIAVSLNAEILPYAPPEDFSIVQNVAKLHDFGGLQRVKNNAWRDHVKTLETMAKFDKRTKEERIINDDRLFDALRFPAYELVKLHGKKALSVEWLEEIGMQCKDTFGKCESDVKSKAKAIYAWIIDNYALGGRWADWTLEERAKYRRIYRKERGLVEMNRAEAAAKATAVRQERTKAKIQGAINVLILLNKKITAEAVAKEAKVARATAQKYLIDYNFRETQKMITGLKALNIEQKLAKIKEHEKH
ncbi:MAG: hypothetical protein IE909_16375, partial [Campylobacterales bacterium]|nr:hypothetical protein [Campylobacterales bacterium]